ncbi:hypothetical protein HanPSC8_Chr12g0506921 [Helianthus annuus]|nr:hypothetical protein HanPSC8_Chr12g0506921 [Helianthus annuus]
MIARYEFVYFTFDPIIMLIQVTLSSIGYVEICGFIWLMHHRTFGLIHSILRCTRAAPQRGRVLILIII